MYSRSATFCAKPARFSYDATVSMREAGPAAGVILEVCPVRRALPSLTSTAADASSTALNSFDVNFSVARSSSSLPL